MADILSVGIDVGTSTTQVVFSRLHAENTASYFAVPRISITAKEVVYKGAIHTTPLTSPTRIDAEALRELVAGEFAAAGYTPADTQTGAVIITGESARKENAAAVLESLSGFAGEFVVSTAGPDMEAIIAGKGSGAEQYSKEKSCRTINLDIGGGTTNIALFDCGELAEKGCLDIGGRLVRLDDQDVVLSVSPPAATAAAYAGLPLAVGVKATACTLKRLAAVLAGVLEQQLGLAPETPLLRRLQTPGSSWCPTSTRPQAVYFSGGVADCIFHPPADPLQYGDLGVYLGRAIAEGRLMTSLTVGTPTETIRATVVGAGSYTTSISGSTIHFTPGIFPLKNVPVLRLTPAQEESCMEGDQQQLRSRLRWFLRQSDSEQVALAIAGSQDPLYSRLLRMAQCVAQVLDSELPSRQPLLVVVEQDMAKAMGQLMSRQLAAGRRLAVVDGIHLQQGDYIDFGRPIMNDAALPVVVKTLIFG